MTWIVYFFPTFFLGQKHDIKTKGQQETGNGEQPGSTEALVPMSESFKNHEGLYDSWLSHAKPAILNQWARAH